MNGDNLKKPNTGMACASVSAFAAAAMGAGVALALLANSPARAFFGPETALSVQDSRDMVGPYAPRGSAPAKVTPLGEKASGIEAVAYVKPGVHPQAPMFVVASIKSQPNARVCVGFMPLEAMGFSKDVATRRGYSSFWNPQCTSANKSGWLRVEQQFERTDVPDQYGTPSSNERPQDGVVILVTKVNTEINTFAIRSSFFDLDSVKPKP